MEVGTVGKGTEPKISIKWTLFRVKRQGLSYSTEIVWLVAPPSVALVQPTYFHSKYIVVSTGVVPTHGGFIISNSLILLLPSANGHITLNTPVLVRSLKLSSVEPSQYLDG